MADTKPAVPAKPAPQALSQRQITLKKFDDYFSPANRQAFLAKAGAAAGIDAARATSAVLNYVVRDEYLAACSPESVFDCCVAALQVGLVVGKELGHAWLVPFKGVCTLILGWKGMAELARRSGEVTSIEVFVVHQNEVSRLRARRGTTGYFEFDPIMFGQRGAIVGYVGLVKLKTGGFDFETMDRAEVEQIRGRSSSWRNRPDASPWTSDFDQMALKTVLKRLLKRQPMSAEAVEQIAQDEDREFREAKDVTPASNHPALPDPAQSGAMSATEALKNDMRAEPVYVAASEVVGAANAEPVAGAVVVEDKPAEKRARAKKGEPESKEPAEKPLDSGAGFLEATTLGDMLAAAESAEDVERAGAMYEQAKVRIGGTGQSRVEKALADARGRFPR